MSTQKNRTGGFFVPANECIPVVRKAQEIAKAKGFSCYDVVALTGLSDSTIGRVMQWDGRKRFRSGTIRALNEFNVAYENDDAPAPPPPRPEPEPSPPATPDAVELLRDVYPILPKCPLRDEVRDFLLTNDEYG